MKGRKNRACFIDINKSIQIAYWHQEWEVPPYGQLPKVYDDEGVYQPKVERWAYVPDSLLEEFGKKVVCPAYFSRPNKYDRCIGTKEIDICLCGGDRRKCDFYEY